MLRDKILTGVTIGLLTIVAILDWRYGVSRWTYVALLLAYGVVRGLGSFLISSQFFIPSRCRGDQTRGSIAITFDDGPLSGKTDNILAILKRYEAPATFFCIGSRVDREPALMRRIHEEGHLVGNHSYYHGKMFDLQSSIQIEKELTDTNYAIARSIGKIPRFFRPPYGVTNPTLAKAVKKGNFTTIGWNIRSFDTIIKERTRLFDRVTRNLKAGDLILFHDYAPATLEILPDFLDFVKRKGLKIERLDTFLQEEPYV